MNRKYKNYTEHAMMSMKMMMMVNGGGEEEMMETGQTVGYLGRIVIDPKSETSLMLNNFDNR